jgi:hypothetical protein
MRFRRVMFGLVPESFKEAEAEQAYIAKFQRLIEYLEKLREKEDSESSLKIKIVSSIDERADGIDDVLKTRRGTSESMIRFTVQLRKGKRDPFEWIEMAVDSTFDTTKSYRIMFNWLVASSAKVEPQVQLLHRRCTQFGLQLISFPQTTVASNLFLHPVGPRKIDDDDIFSISLKVIIIFSSSQSRLSFASGIKRRQSCSMTP